MGDQNDSLESRFAAAGTASTNQTTDSSDSLESRFASHPGASMPTDSAATPPSAANRFTTSAVPDNGVDPSELQEGPSMHAAPSLGSKLVSDIKGSRPAVNMWHDLTEPIENYTQEGRKEHPVLSRVGDVTRKIGNVAQAIPAFGTPVNRAPGGVDNPSTVNASPIAPMPGIGGLVSEGVDEALANPRPLVPKTPYFKPGASQAVEITPPTEAQPATGMATGKATRAPLLNPEGGAPLNATENPVFRTPKPAGGRLVLSEDEAAAQDRLQTAAEGRAHDRGMQYAAGMKPGGGKVIMPGAEPVQVGTEPGFAEYTPYKATQAVEGTPGNIKTTGPPPQEISHLNYWIRTNPKKAAAIASIISASGIVPGGKLVKRAIDFLF